jgi:hypothetical protein
MKMKSSGGASCGWPLGKHTPKLSVGAEDQGVLGYVDDSYSGSDAYHLRQTRSSVVVQSQAHASLGREVVML